MRVCNGFYEWLDALSKILIAAHSNRFFYEGDKISKKSAYFLQTAAP